MTAARTGPTMRHGPECSACLLIKTAHTEGEDMKNHADNIANILVELCLMDLGGIRSRAYVPEYSRARNRNSHLG